MRREWMLHSRSIVFWCLVCTGDSQAHGVICSSSPILHDAQVNYGSVEDFMASLDATQQVEAMSFEKSAELRALRFWIISLSLRSSACARYSQPVPVP